MIHCRGDCQLNLTKKHYFNTDDPEKIDHIGALHCCETALKTRLEQRLLVLKNKSNEIKYLEDYEAIFNPIRPN
tara:strand:+ start:300 stop:521 length:222 start_codon:yes stop_codon:yes gene_type:complete